MKRGKSKKERESLRDRISASKLAPKTPLTGPKMSNRMRKRLRKLGKLPKPGKNK